MEFLIFLKLLSLLHLSKNQTVFIIVKYNKIMLFRVEYHKAEFLAPLNIKNSYIH